MRTLLAALALVAAPALAQVQIDHPWARATPPGAKTAAGYMLIRNPSASPERLVGAKSPGAARVETHVHIKEGDVFRMRQVQGFDIPAKGSLELKPGGAHLMFVDIRQPFKEGEKVPVTLEFEKAGAVSLELEVAPMGAAAHKH
jgi:copper(I)-binding protein